MTNRRGFTIIELMVTVIILTMLVIAASSGIVRARRVGRDGQRIRDVLAIATVMDQAATTNRGLYPYNTTTQSTNVFCADKLGVSTASGNLNSLNFGLFTSRAIPKDPLPERTSAACVNYRDGYTVNNRWGAGNNLARTASGLGFEYILEVGLEGDKPYDEQTLTAGTDATSTKRKQFLVQGKACGTTTTCSLQ
jgi:prepilin-type N-terminal cleavage/methylation domain-containing protein